MTEKLDGTTWPQNTVPVAVNDSYTTDEDTALSIAAPGVLENDMDADKDVLTVVLVTGPAHGTLALNADGSFTYTPVDNYHGSDGFTYKANDGKAESDAAVVTIDVAPVNSAPVAQDQAVTTQEDTALTITLEGSDVDGDPLTFTVVQAPSHGSLGSLTQLTPTSAQVTYTPTADYHGPDGFTYKANDGKADSEAATVDIVINPVNDAPVLLPRGTQTGRYLGRGEYSDPIQKVTIVAADLDNECAEMQFAARGLPEGLVLANNGDCTATIQGTLLAASGSYSYVVTVSDGAGGVDAADATFMVMRESAALSYTGDQEASGPPLGVVVNLRASITEQRDGSPGSALAPLNTPTVGFHICDATPALGRRRCYDVPATSVKPIGKKGAWEATATLALPYGRWLVVAQLTPTDRYFEGPDSASAFIVVGPPRPGRAKES
ncbi:MAG: tandem-95 repeat protein [Chloroflexi bacterium]|nr:tandem-95 repeat protein [Chloroflexota bacterium]